MELLQLKYFVTVARTENVSATARLFQVPQPSISQSISRLENELGTPLFNRTSNKISLNENGKFLYEQLNIGLSIIDDAVSTLKNQKNLSGEINILVLAHRSTLIDIINEFNKLHNNVTFNVSYAEKITSVYNYDVIINSQKEPFKDFTQVLLLKEDVKLSINSKNSLSALKEITLKDLHDETLLFTRKESSLYRLIESIMHENNYDMNNCLFCNDLFCLKRYFDINRGIAFIPCIAWKDLFPSNTNLITIKDVNLTRNSYLLTNNSNKKTITTTFAKFLVSKFSLIQSNNRSSN